MAYIVTGGTGFIGKHLIDRLILRGQPIYVLVRASSRANLETLRATRWNNSALIHALVGDIGSPCCAVEAPPKASALFHLAAIYDMGVGAEAAWRANVDGTKHAIELAAAAGATLQHVSSIAVTGGVVPGVFTEEMFDRGQKLDHPYYATNMRNPDLWGRYEITLPHFMVLFVACK